MSQLTLVHASSDIPLGVLIELPNCAPLSIQVLLRLPQKLRQTSLSPLMQHSLKLWDSVRYSISLMSHFLPLLPITNNPLFPPWALPATGVCVGDFPRP